MPPRMDVFYARDINAGIVDAAATDAFVDALSHTVDVTSDDIMTNIDVVIVNNTAVGVIAGVNTFPRY